LYATHQALHSSSLDCGCGLIGGLTPQSAIFYWPSTAAAISEAEPFAILGLHAY